MRLVKICGLRDEKNIQAVAALKPDLMGFIFYPESKRYVGKNFKLPEIRDISLKTKTVAVFVNETLDRVVEIVQTHQFNYIQLHGSESPQYCSNLAAKGLKILKAFGIHATFDWSLVLPYQDVCDFFLFDTSTKGYGGSGEKFEWNVLCQYAGSCPFFLSGGIGPNDVESIQNMNHKQFAGIDINSKFEVEPGLKDINLLENFLNQLQM
jgi:phosphoribosylanthranilate isomerase